MKPKLTVVKIGGNVIEEEQKLHAFLNDFAQVAGPKILIHGGGSKATELSDRLGITTTMHEGRRITSKENLEVITMVYAGLINKSIVAQLQAFNCNAIGLSGADGNAIKATKRPVNAIDFGWVGDVEEVNASTIDILLQQHITPVFCAISHDQKGQLLNTNADTIAAEVAIAMSSHYETTLVYCFEKNGVLMDVDDEKSIIPSINGSYYEQLRAEQVIHKGMVPKMDNAFHALNNNVAKVIIRNANLSDTGNNNFTSITL